MFVARDTYGVRPLFISSFKKTAKIDINGAEYYESFAFSSEVKQIVNLNSNAVDENIRQFEPGCLAIFKYNGSTIEHIKDMVFSSPNSFCVNKQDDYNTVLKNVYDKLYDAVAKRVDNTEREIACLRGII